MSLFEGLDDDWSVPIGGIGAGASSAANNKRVRPVQVSLERLQILAATAGTQSQHVLSSFISKQASEIETSGKTVDADWLKLEQEVCFMGGCDLVPKTFQNYIEISRNSFFPTFHFTLSVFYYHFCV